MIPINPYIAAIPLVVAMPSLAGPTYCAVPRIYAGSLTGRLTRYERVAGRRVGTKGS